MSMPGKGEGAFQFPFGSAWRASRAGMVFTLERQRSASATWESGGWFDSRREAERTMRDLARLHPEERFRIRMSERPRDEEAEDR